MASSVIIGKRDPCLANFICLSTGEHQGQEVEVGGEGMGDFWDSIGNVIEENTLKKNLAFRSAPAPGHLGPGVGGHPQGPLEDSPRHLKTTDQWNTTSVPIQSRGT